MFSTAELQPTGVLTMYGVDSLELKVTNSDSSKQLVLTLNARTRRNNLVKSISSFQ